MGSSNKGHFRPGTRADGKESRAQKLARVASQAKNVMPTKIVTTMAGEVMTVTPEVAGKWLEHNYNGQRKISWNRVERYANDMREGRWQVTHQGVAFAPDGTLLDGQHRLWAIIQAEVPVALYVVRNADPKTYSVLDQGAGRSLAVASGGRWNAAEMAAGRAMWTGSSRRQKRSDSPAIMLDFMERHGDRIRNIRNITKGGARATAWMRPQVVAALARATYHLPMTTIERFVVAASTGVVSGPEDTAALLLRDWMTVRTARGDDERWEFYRRTCWAIECFVNKKEVVRLNMVPADIDPFPLPEDDQDA